MKIFYAVQATGNGHISRAAELYPALNRFGEVDIFLSGNNSSLHFTFPVKYRSKGLSLYYNKSGGINYWETLKNIKMCRTFREINSIPLEKYDVILNDFDCITSLACKHKNIPSLHFGHQASFAFPSTPRPVKRSAIGEWILQNYAQGSSNLGLHFWVYSPDILTPVIRKSILQSQPKSLPYICVYLNQYPLTAQFEHFQKMNQFQFQIFSKEVTKPMNFKNMELLPIDNQLFTKSLVDCSGIITGAGFETPAEALYLKKKLLIIPVKGQYEQLCNAEALKEWNVLIASHLHQIQTGMLEDWLHDKKEAMFQILHSTEDIAQIAIEKAIQQKRLPK